MRISSLFISLFALTLVFGVQAEAATTLDKVKNVRASNITDTTAKILWNKVERAKKYSIKLYDADKDLINTLTSKKKYKQLSNLDPETVYYVRVRAKRSKNVGPLSKFKRFETEAVTSDDDETVDPTDPDDGDDEDGAVADFGLTSDAFSNNGTIPVAYTCDGSGTSPDLSWTDAPSGTQSFMLLVLDVDAADFVHWGVKNISASATSVAADGVPTGGTEFLNDFGLPGWGSPCPPFEDAAHTYVFTLYALDTDSVSSSTVSEALTEISDNILDAATLSGEYDA